MHKPTLEVVTLRSPCLALCMLVWALLACGNLQAADTLLLLSSNAATYQQVAGVIQSNTPDRSSDIQSLDEVASPAEMLQKYKLIIAIGSRATDHAFRHAADNSTVLSSFIPASRFKPLRSQYQNSLSKRNIRTSAIYLDQPLRRQIRLAQLIKPGFQRLGLTLGPDSAPLLEQIIREADYAGLTLNHTTLSQNDNPIQKIGPVIQNSDLFLVIPDKNTFNKTTAKWLLYMSFRNQVPLLAFSQNYVQAGAIAACISTPEDIGRFTAEQIRLISDRFIPAPAYSPYFRVMTNQRSARKMKLSLPTAETLQQQLLEME